MSGKYKLVENQKNKLEKISDTWANSFNDAKGKLEAEFSLKRRELKSKLSQQKAEEQELFKDYQKTDLQLSQDINRLVAQQISSIESQSTYAMTQKDPESDRRSQQLNQIFTDSHNEVVTVLDRHRERVRLLDQNLAQKAIHEKRLTQFTGQNVGADMSALKARQKALIDEKNSKMSETMSRLEANRKEIENKLKELAEIERKEREQIDGKADMTIAEESKERQKEVNKFTDKAKKMFETN